MKHDARVKAIEKHIPAPIHEARAFLPEGDGLFRERIPGGELFTREQIEEWGAGNDNRMAIFYKFVSPGEV